MKLQTERKKVQKTITDVGHCVESLQDEIKAIQSQLSAKECELSKLKEKHSRLDKAKNINVTDHALLRYIERMLGVDVEKIRNEIITDETRWQVYVLGDGKYPVNNNHYAIIKDNNLITVYPVKE